MMRVIVFVATFATLSFSGCASTQTAGSGSLKAGSGAMTADYSYRKGEASPLVDAIPVDRARLYDDVVCPADNFGLTRCRVQVDVAVDGMGTCTIKAPNITFDKPDRRYVVTWVPPSNDYRFCPLLGDGVTFKDQAASDDEQFDDAWAGDNAGDFGDGASFRGKGCFKRFRMWAANTKPNEQYNFNMQFRNISNKKICKVDPFIRNGR